MAERSEADSGLTPSAAAPLSSAEIREQFPALASQPGRPRLVYLDNASTTQKPRAVLDALDRHHHDGCANVHRGLYSLALRATEDYERSRRAVARFIGAGDPNEIVFTRGTTEAINLVAASFGSVRVRSDDEILLTEMEHHSNIVPWQLLRERTGARLSVVPVDENGDLRLEEFVRRCGPRTRLVAVTLISNVLGTVNPVRQIAEIAHAAGAKVLVDAAQAAAHHPIDVEALDCDFLAFSGHKAYGPSGIGILWARRELLEEMPPWAGGGEMIESVRFERTTFAAPPYRFEAGTPPISGAIGLGAAVEWIEDADVDRLAALERPLGERARIGLARIARVRVLGNPTERCAIVPFVVDGIHAHDLATVLDAGGVAVRAGHHCAQPLAERLGTPATVRASFAAYNTAEDVEALLTGVERSIEILGR